MSGFGFLRSSRIPAPVETRAGAVAPSDGDPTENAQQEAVEPDLPHERYTTPDIDWTDLIEKVKAGSADGLDRLYRLFARGIRFHFCRQLGAQELDDKVHDTFLVIVEAIQKGDLREPDRLMGFVRTIVRRQVAYYINASVQKRRDEVDLDTGVRLRDRSRNPEQTAMSQETRRMILHVLERLSARDREILTRFYLYEQTQDQICDEMELTDTQFRLLKSRAKARFGEIGKKKLAQGALSALFVRTSATALH